jgi:hypothetical protein
MDMEEMSHEKGIYVHVGINATLEIISLYLPWNAKVRKDRL